MLIEWFHFLLIITEGRGRAPNGSDSIQLWWLPEL